MRWYVKHVSRASVEEAASASSNIDNNRFVFTVNIKVINSMRIDVDEENSWVEFGITLGVREAPILR